MRDKGSKSVWIMPVLAGLAGALVALLFAPRSGKDTRQRMRSNAERLKDQAADNLNSARTGVEDGLHKAKEVKDRLSEAITLKGRKSSEIDQEDGYSTSKRNQASSPVLTNWEEEV